MNSDSSSISLKKSTCGRFRRAAEPMVLWLCVSERLLIRAVSIIRAQFLDLAGQGVASPAEQVGGIASSATGVFQGNVDQGPFKQGRGFIENAGIAHAELLIRPGLQILRPVPGRGRLGLLLREFGWQV